MLRKIARLLLLIITAIVITFALLSGSEEHGGGFMRIIKNSPNALPWLLLFGLNYLAWKRELVGGSIIAMFGLYVSLFLSFNGGKFAITVIATTSFITILGFIFIYLGINKNKNDE